MFKYFFIVAVLASCQPAPPADVELSQELKDAIENNDTTAAKKIAQRELHKSRASITDSSFAALIDASLSLQTLEFKIQKSNTLNNKEIDTALPDNQYLVQLYYHINRVYYLAAERSIQKRDRDYYNTKINTTRENWIADNFRNKTKKELQIILLLLQQDVAVASGIINGVDTKETRKETEGSYKRSIEMIQQSN